MEKTAFDNRYHGYLNVIENYLNGLFVQENHWTDLYEAMRYSLLSGGKRLRPVMTLEFARLCGLDWHAAVPVGCALELVHTYSLIHDDLPCMDNDDFRRGRPSCHKKFGEATALLAGDGLLTKAFGVAAEAELPGDVITEAVKTLSAFAGPEGMVAGQMIDLTNEKVPPTASVLELTYRLKTSALLQAACRMGVLAGGGNEAQLAAAGDYAYKLGMAFQIVDDILDVTGDSAVLGKPVGSDAANGKVTFVTLLGLEGAREMAAEYSRSALTALAAFPGSEELYALTEQLLSRRS